MKRGWFGAFATLLGTTIGAGIFGIPYVVAKAGLFTGILVIILVTLIVGTISLYLAEILLRTKEHHQLIGLGEIYFGRTGKFLIAAAMIFQIYGALVAYSIGVGEALASILNLNPLIISIIFIAVLSFLIYFGIKIFQGSEEILASLVIFAVLLITIFSIKYIKLENLTGFSIKNIFIPYGVVLFASLGIFAVPEMKKELTDKKLLKRSVITGVSVAAIVYIIFAIVVVGVTGANTTEVATVGFGIEIGKWMIILANLFAFLTMATAFLSLGFELKDAYYSDYKLSNIVSWLLVVIVPVTFVLLNIIDFIRIIELSAVIGDGLMLTLITIMHSKAKKIGKRKPEFTVYGSWWLKTIFIILFIVAAVITFR